PSTYSATLQRAGGDSAGTHAGDNRHLRRHSPPELHRIAHQCARIGPRVSVGGGRAARHTLAPAAPRPHSFGRSTARAVRRRVRRVLGPDITAHSWGLLKS